MRSAFIPVEALGDSGNILSHSFIEESASELRKFNEAVSESQDLLRQRLDLNTEVLRHLGAQLRADMSKLLKEELEVLSAKLSEQWHAEVSCHAQTYQGHSRGDAHSLEKLIERMETFDKGRNEAQATQRGDVLCASLASEILDFEDSTNTTASYRSIRKSKPASPRNIPSVHACCDEETDSETTGGVTFAANGLMVFSSVLVLLNSIFIGIKVQVTLDKAKQGSHEPLWVFWVDAFLAAAFVFEFFLRLAVLRSQALAKKERAWTLFEFVLIVTNVLEYVMSTYDMILLRALRVLRVARVLRALRGTNHVHELRLILASMLSSLKTLAWASAFLAFILYTVAVFIAMDLTVHIQAAPHVDSLLMELYGDIPTCMLSLFMAITGGNDWEALMRPLQTMSYHFYLLFYVVFVFTTLFGIMNVLTGIFCDAASRVQGVDRELVISDQMEETNKVAKELRALFDMCAQEGSLDLKGLESQLQNPQVVDFLTFLDVNISDVPGLFKVLDVDGTGRVGADEFVVRMMRLRGTARSIDMAMMLHENRKLCAQLSALAQFTEQNFEMLDASMRGEHFRKGVPLEQFLMKEEANEQNVEKRTFVREEILRNEREKTRTHRR